MLYHCNCLWAYEMFVQKMQLEYMFERQGVERPFTSTKWQQLSLQTLWNAKSKREAERINFGKHKKRGGAKEKVRYLCGSLGRMQIECCMQQA